MNITTKGIRVFGHGEDFWVIGENAELADKIFRQTKKHYGLNQTDNGSKGVRFMVEELPEPLASLQPGESVNLPGFFRKTVTLKRDE